MVAFLTTESQHLEKRPQRPSFKPLFMQMRMLRQKGGDLSEGTQVVGSRARTKLSLLV